MWQIITYFKISNQQDTLAMFEKDLSAIQLLSDYKEQIELGDKTNREGHANERFILMNSLVSSLFD